MPFNPKVKYIIEIGLLLSIAIIAALAISVGFTTYLGNPKHPHVAVTTGSMIPIYNGFFQLTEYDDIEVFQGDILLVRKVPIDTIEVGDVIIFNTSAIDEAVVHRVVAIWENDGTYYFKTKGDNNDYPDIWPDGITTGDNIFGIVVIRIPHVGWFLLTVQTTLGRIIIFLLAILVLFIGDESEDKKANNIGNSSLKDQTNNSKITTSTFIKLGRKIVHSRNYFYFSCALLIITSFLGINLLSSAISPPSVKLYSLEDTFKNKNLLLSTDSLIYDLSIPNSYYERYNWYQKTNITKVYLFPIQIEIRSGGLFNNIKEIEIISLVNGNEGFYRWTIVYNFIGIKSFEGGIIAFLNPNETTHTADISVTLYSRGLFGTNPQRFEFPLILDSS